MDKIYKAGDQVLIWLGDEVPGYSRLWRSQIRSARYRMRPKPVCAIC